jgi:hypothetical protein
MIHAPRLNPGAAVTLARLPSDVVLERTLCMARLTADELDAVLLLGELGDRWCGREGTPKASESVR